MPKDPTKQEFWMEPHIPDDIIDMETEPSCVLVPSRVAPLDDTEIAVMDEGSAHRKAGKPLNADPYPPGRKSDLWRSGWFKQDEQE